jgi:catechol 2,3-dioxygenase-like lactoylglutathione lyase family enzyme
MNILDFVMIGSNDYEKSAEFYDAVLEPLKLKKILKTEKYIGYAHLSKPDKVQFYVTNPINGEPATFGNGTQITLLADTKEDVKKFYEIAILKGGFDEGRPGVRKDGNYYAYIRDLDGNKIAAKSILK